MPVLAGTLNAFELEKNSEMGKKEEEEKRLEMQTNKSLYELLLTFFIRQKLMLSFLFDEKMCKSNIP